MTIKKLNLIIIILLLVLLGLTQIHSSIAMKDVQLSIVGDNVLSSAKIVNVTSNGAIVTPISGTYLIPNGNSYTVFVTANSDGLGLAPIQTVADSFTAPKCGCTIVSSTVAVHATMQAILE